MNRKVAYVALLGRRIRWGGGFEMTRVGVFYFWMHVSARPKVLIEWQRYGIFLISLQSADTLRVQRT